MFAVQPFMHVAAMLNFNYVAIVYKQTHVHVRIMQSHDSQALTKLLCSWMQSSFM